MMYAYYVRCIYSNALKTNFITEENTMNPDQTAPSLIRVHIVCNIGQKQKREQTTMKKVNKQCLLDTPRTVRVNEKT